MPIQNTSSVSRPKPIVVRRDLDGHRYQAANNEGFSDLSARVLAGRPGSSRAITASAHARPSISELDDMACMADIDPAAERLALAVMSDEHIGIETDHDVDGVTSHAILKQGLIKLCGHSPELVHSFIGHRLKDGYGLSRSLAERIISHPQRCGLVVTADNGSSDQVRIHALAQEGIDTIVTDHHGIPAEGIPRSALAVLNPTREDCDYPDPLIAGCMVAWLLLTHTIKRLEQYGHLQPGHADTSSLLDFVAIGTVADCVSMARSLNNRAVVRAGLGLMNTQCRPAWQVAASELSKEGLELTEKDIGFGLAPRINARGRLDEAMAGVHFLLSETVKEAREWWALLDAENEQRKLIEKNLKNRAMSLADDAMLQGRVGFALWLEDGHPGVHGIVASRVVESFGRPVVCISPVYGSETLVTGSARGVPGIHIKDAFDEIAASYPDLLVRAGGHAGAGGLTINKSDLPLFQDAWDKAIEQQVIRDGITLGPVIQSDGNLANPCLEDVWSLQDELGPFGREFEAPVWEGEFFVLDVKPRGDGSHLALMLQAGQSKFQAIWFNSRETLPSGQLEPMPIEPGAVASLCFAIENNRFRGVDRLQLRVIAKV